MGPVKNQGNHEVCWALVSAELVSVVRYVRGHDRVKVDYSIQDIVDFTNKEERRLRKDTGHYCYPWTIEDTLTVLHEHPVAAEIPIFVPEYTNIENKIYRGPTTSSSVFTSMHAVNIIGAATEENGEKYVYVRSSHGETLGVNGNLKVSIEIMMMCLTPGVWEISTVLNRYVCLSPNMP
ncbi:unnamed protein product [Brassica oleracea var. botrytis]